MNLYQLSAAVVVIGVQIITNITPAHVEHPSPCRDTGNGVIECPAIAIDLYVGEQTNITKCTTLGTVECKEYKMEFAHKSSPNWPEVYQTNWIESVCSTNIIGVLETNLTEKVSKP